MSACVIRAHTARQGSSKLEEPIIEKKGRAKDLITEGGNVPAAFNILLCPQQYAWGSSSHTRTHHRARERAF